MRPLNAARFLPIAVRARGVDRGEPLGDRGGDLERTPWVAEEVRVAAGVEIAAAPVHDAGRHVEHLDDARGGEAARAAGLDLRVARLVHERRQPADLEVEPDVHEEIGVPELHREDGVRVHEVRILDAARQALDADAIAADLARERGEPLGGGDDPGIGGGERGEEQRESSDERGAHGDLLERVRAVRADAELELEQRLEPVLSARPPVVRDLQPDPLELRREPGGEHRRSGAPSRPPRPPPWAPSRSARRSRRSGSDARTPAPSRRCPCRSARPRRRGSGARRARRTARGTTGSRGAGSAGTGPPRRDRGTRRRPARRVAPRRGPPRGWSSPRTGRTARGGRCR